MIDWNSEYCGILVGAFWIGFSLFFYATFMFLIALRTGRNSKSDPLARLPLVRRLIITLPSFIGVGGSVFIMGEILSRWPYTDIAAVLGFPAGIFVARFIDRSLSKNNK